MRLRPFFLSAVLIFCCTDVQAMKITSLYSPRNAERERRPRTDYIILHTTEAPKGSALRKLRRNGETHYLVDTDGHVYRIVHRSRVAFHAGRSMWEGKTNLDNYSIGVEVVGYHNRDFTMAQYTALKELLGELRKIYGIPSERVLTHSMVAYGTPNRWHKRSHRGRKRCAMNLASRSTRLKLGLDRAPAYDPDVKANRLVAADPYLARVLYGEVEERGKPPGPLTGGTANVIAPGRSAWDIARDRYRSPDTLYVLPGGKMVKGDEITDWKAVPAGTRVVISADYRDNTPEQVKTIGLDGASARDIAGEELDRATTVYFLPDGRIRRGNELSEGSIARLPAKTRMLVGYVHGGYVTARRSAFDVCGPLWNHASTFYRFPDGSIESGNSINENAIPKGTQVFFQE